ncbi:lysine N(6)-hydroxylase/L-ornithine N(5)-oxygenase family protein [Microbispora sp. ATCC PTA-5024]|uniref:lysine N(6)-hydroxylase/L-ornithine N(5)-oxygenase family protein n=1 Tax=Microbispora sp. ATCC PTA-5024 TaxID=316330 RepID=UPI00056CC74D|nr:SidA/IucD/PvdA family monooxygenase [Microbispora sp. ATCC PTA-5024]
MKHRDVELLAIGAGPANLALAVAVEELAPGGLAAGSLVIEQAGTVAWQPGMLLPEAQSQVSFLKDLVTLRNPCSRFSFVNYLHAVGRLSEFINVGSLWPYRIEISDYLAWVADSLSRVRLEYNRRCTAVEPLRDAEGTLTGWLTRLADGSTIRSRYLVMGIGRDVHVPKEFAALPARRVVHSTRYVQRIAELPKGVPYRVAVIGGGQSAAEMFDAVQRDLPGCQPTLVTRSIGLKTYENSKFTNELYFPSAVDAFFGARPEARRQILDEMHITNYSGLNPATLDKLYHALYLDRLTGKGRLRVLTMHDVTSAREDSDEVVLELTDRRTGGTEELRCDLVLLGTGFVRAMPGLVRGLAGALGLEDVSVNRTYRLAVPGPATAACYLQGVNEATHGIADSLLSMQAVRAWEITADILADRADGGAGSLAAVPSPAVAVPVPAN